MRVVNYMYASNAAYARERLAFWNTTASSQSRASEDISQRVRECQVLDNGELRWPLKPPLRLNLDAAYRDVFIAAYSQGCQMPHHQNESDQNRIHVNVCCGSWVDSVCINRSASADDLLSNALLASALTVMGETSHNVAMARYAVELENRVLATLRHKLRGRMQKCQDTELSRLTMTVLTVAVANPLVKKSWQAFNLHLKGVAALVELAGAESSLD